jgi:hypothetical protein
MALHETADQWPRYGVSAKRIFFEFPLTLKSVA